MSSANKMVDEEESSAKDPRQRKSLSQIPIPHLPYCGYTCNLRTGSWIILWIYLIISVLYISGPLFRDRSFEKVTPPVNDNIRWSYPERHDPYYVLDWSIIFVGCGSFLFSAIGLLAIYKTDAKLLRLFLIWKLLQIVFEAYLVVYLMTFLPFIFRVPLGIILVGLACYTWLIVYSYHRDIVNINDKNQQPTPP